MDKMRFFAYTLISNLVFYSCISPLDTEVNDPDRELVVDGFITNASGPHQVRITRLTEFGGISNRPNSRRNVSNADVTVTNINSGVAILLDEVEAGLYETPQSFEGEVGQTYVLSITTTGQNVYMSTPQTIPEGPEIDSVLFRFKKLPSTDPVTAPSGVEIYTQWHDPPGDNFHLWIEHQATYIPNARPDQYTDPQFGTPAPKSCCFTCYIPETINQLNVLSDFRQEEDTLTAFVAFIEDDGRRLSVNYFMELNQYSISREAFEFYSNVKSLLDIDGDIFDPPPNTLRGNISNVDHAEERVTGFFGAFNVKTQAIRLGPSLLTEKKRVIVVKDDCRTISRASTVRPEIVDKLN